MIKVRLHIALASDMVWDEELQKYIKKDINDMLVDYDKETWKDDNIIEFPNLKSAEEFRRSCPIKFKPEVYENDSDWDYHYVDTSIYIDDDNDELVIVVDAGKGYDY